MCRPSNDTVGDHYGNVIAELCLFNGIVAG